MLFCFFSSMFILYSCQLLERFIQRSISRWKIETTKIQIHFIISGLFFYWTVSSALSTLPLSYTLKLIYRPTMYNGDIQLQRKKNLLLILLLSNYLLSIYHIFGLSNDLVEILKRNKGYCDSIIIRRISILMDFDGCL